MEKSGKCSKWRRSLSLLKASEHLYVKASENVGDSEQSRAQVSLPHAEVDRKTGILLRRRRDH